MTCDRRTFAGLLAAAACVLAAGCSEPKPVKVSGRVTLDGADLKEGQITFVHSDASKGAEAASIENGRFEAMAWPGANKVKVNAARELPKKGEFSYFEEIIPEKYNEKTELTLDVPTGGATDKVFELTGGKKK